MGLSPSSSLRARRKKGRERGREKSTPLPFSLFPYPLPLSTPATQAIPVVILIQQREDKTIAKLPEETKVL